MEIELHAGAEIGEVSEYSCDVDGCGKTFETPHGVRMHKNRAHRVNGEKVTRKYQKAGGVPGLGSTVVVTMHVWDQEKGRVIVELRDGGRSWMMEVVE